MSILLASLLLRSASVVTIDPTVKRGPWEGWGTSLCWMGNVFGTRDDLADLLFTTKRVRVGDETLPGLGLTIVRYNVGAGGPNEVEGRRMVVSKNVLPYRRMEGFWLDPSLGEAGWDWSRDAAQRAMMLKAKRRGADRFELFSNSPMWWMCVNANPSGAAKATDDNLRPESQNAFATYLATIAAQSKRRWGVEFTTVEPFNEPFTDYWDAEGRQEGCHFSPATQAAFLPKLRAELDRQGLRGLPIAASDETSFDHALETWTAFDPTAKALVGQVNVHGYKHTEPSRAAFRRATLGKRLWNSEHGDGDASGLSTMRELSLDLNVLQPSAWCYWQPFDGGGWGLLDCDMVAAKTKRALPKLFVLAQYTRHIRPGMTILGSSDPHTVAAYDAKRHRLVIVAENEKETAEKTLDLSRFSKVGRSARAWTTEPKASARYARRADLGSQNKRLALSLPPSSVVTLELDGVEP